MDTPCRSILVLTDWWFADSSFFLPGRWLRRQPWSPLIALSRQCWKEIVRPYVGDGQANRARLRRPRLCRSTALKTDLGKSRRERNWPIRANRAARGVIRVHLRSQIARTRALFDRFSDEYENRETGWWSRRDLKPQESPENLRFFGPKCVPKWPFRYSLPHVGQTLQPLAENHTFRSSHCSDPTNCKACVRLLSPVFDPQA